MTKSPRITVGLPIRNGKKFLTARIESIRHQTFRDFEVVVVDGNSGDGSWEELQNWGAEDPRVRLERQKPNGIYPAFNRCVELSRGQFMYIATADDTMALDCLEKLGNALEKNPRSGIAHCPLRTIDESGKEIELGWSKTSTFARSSADFISRYHVRPVPFDAALHLLGESVYWSATQLLVRRNVYEAAGLYRGEWGPVGDFNWSMRAALVTPTVHVPDTWAGWRIHRQQATDSASLASVEHLRKAEAMIRHAVETAGQGLPVELRHLLVSKEARYFIQRRILRTELQGGKTAVGRWLIVLRNLLSGNRAALDRATWSLTRHGRWTLEDMTLFERWTGASGLDAKLCPA